MPTPPRRIPRETDAASERFQDFVAKDPATGCWVWTGAKFTQGYGCFTLEGQVYRAHRVAYAWAFGDTRDELDHTCHRPDECEGGFGCPHRACVNPDHLEPSSRRDNVLRGRGPSAENAQRTHCANGHEFTDENTRYDKGGWRQCRACGREKTRRYREQNHEKVLARRRELRAPVVHEPRSCARPGCDNLFVPVRGSKKYCSVSCLQRDGYAHRNQTKEA